MATPYVAQVLAQVSWLLAYGTYALVAMGAALAVLCIPVETIGRAPPADVAELQQWVRDAVADRAWGCTRARRSGYEAVDA
jgi:hypothetical protein